jgi:hypothetical protein
MKARLVSFGEIEVEGKRYVHDVSTDSAPPSLTVSLGELPSARLPPHQGRVGWAMLRPSRCSCSALALLTFKAPGSVAPSGTSTHRPPV